MMDHDRTNDCSCDREEKFTVSGDDKTSTTARPSLAERKLTEKQAALCLYASVPPFAADVYDYMRTHKRAARTTGAATPLPWLPVLPLRVSHTDKHRKYPLYRVVYEPVITSGAMRILQEEITEILWHFYTTRWPHMRAVRRQQLCRPTLHDVAQLLELRGWVCLPRLVSRACPGSRRVWITPALRVRLDAGSVSRSALRDAVAAWEEASVMESKTAVDAGGGRKSR